MKHFVINYLYGNEPLFYMLKADDEENAEKKFLEIVEPFYNNNGMHALFSKNAPSIQVVTIKEW